MLYANVVSEIVIAIPYNLLAFTGSMMLLLSPKDAAADEGVASDEGVTSGATINKV